MSDEQIKETFKDLADEVRAYIEASSTKIKKIRKEKMLKTAQQLVFYKSGKNSISWNPEDEVLLGAAIEQGLQKHTMATIMDFIVLAVDNLAKKKSEELDKLFPSGSRGGHAL